MQPENFIFSASSSVTSVLQLYLPTVSRALSEGQIQAEGQQLTDSGHRLELLSPQPEKYPNQQVLDTPRLALLP